ncbi:MAG: hypothetical protein OXH30_07625, partial [Chloroflexi bacterium]|nr:hypothetical protein [Chloroflexota bacterium]
FKVNNLLDKWVYPKVVSTPRQGFFGPQNFKLRHYRIWNAILGLIPSLAAYLVIGIIGDIAIVIGAIAAGTWVYRAIRRAATP